MRDLVVPQRARRRMVLLDGELQIPHFVRDDNPFQVASGVICRDPSGAKARTDFKGLRGPEGPLFHGDPRIR